MPPRVLITAKFKSSTKPIIQNFIKYIKSFPKCYPLSLRKLDFLKPKYYNIHFCLLRNPWVLPVLVMVTLRLLSKELQKLDYLGPEY